MLETFSVFSFVIIILLKEIASMDFTHLPKPPTMEKALDREARQIPSPKVYRCGDVGKDLVVNFVNSNYPNDDTSAGDCKFRMVITSQHTCQIRVDFVDTELMDPIRGECLSQFFIVQGSIWPTGLPPICGINNDQHFYLHLQPWLTNATVIDFNLVTIVRGRPYRFGVWLTQIDCSSFNVLKAPEGCTQFFLAENGTIKSFNYEGYRYLNAQNYQICIRPVKGACGIRYDAAVGDFAMKKSIVANRDILQRSGVGPAICGTDYLSIPEGRADVESMRRQRILFNKRRRPASNPPPPPKRKKLEVLPSSDRFCGSVLAPNGGERIMKPIFARIRSNLISLRVKTTPLQEESGIIEALNLTTGFRISYRQVKTCSMQEPDLAVPHSIITNVLESLQWNNDGKITLRDTMDNFIQNQFKNTSRLGNATILESLKVAISDDDALWDYLDLHSEDKEGDEKDLYDF